MAKPTHDDADVMLRLVEAWPVDATDWIWSDEFIADSQEYAARHAGGAMDDGKIRAVLNWYETIGTLHKYGLLNEDLLFDWLAVDATWNRVRSHALARREESGMPQIYENFEAMAEAQRAWAASREQQAA